MLQRRGRSKVLAGGTRLVGKSALDGFDFSKGSFLPPTVIADVNVEDELWQEEVFGPVVVVKHFSVSIFITELKQTSGMNILVPYCTRTSAMASHWQMRRSTDSGQVYGPPIYLEHTVWQVISSQAWSGSTRITEMIRALRGVYYTAGQSKPFVD
jgi:delta 1-pyrroline-5-carboxylate dehydrogenase